MIQITNFAVKKQCDLIEDETDLTSIYTQQHLYDYQILNKKFDPKTRVKFNLVI